jgi:hypothetical protein
MDPDDPGSLGTDVALGLAAAAAWAVVTLVRLGVTSPAAVVGVFGCAATSAAPAVVFIRRLGRLDSPFRSWIAAAIVSAGPLAILGAVLKTKTHHRPLGGVTFAFVGTALFVSALVASKRLIELSGAGAASATRFVGRAVLLGSGAISVVLLSKAVLPAFGAQASPFVRGALVDALVGALFIGLAAVAGAAPAPRRTGVLALAVWAVSVGLGVIVLLKNPSVRASLDERAPVTLGIMGAPGDD